MIVRMRRKVELRSYIQHPYIDEGGEGLGLRLFRPKGLCVCKSRVYCVEDWLWNATFIRNCNELLCVCAL